MFSSGIGNMFSSTPSNNGSSYAGYDAGAAQNEQASAANASDTGMAAFEDAIAET